MSYPFARREATVALDGLSVMVGMPTHRDLPPKTVRSLLATQERCHKLGIGFSWGGLVSGVVTWARDDVLEMFLASDANRLFWIDSDIVWTPEQFVRLLALSKLTPVVGATYPAKLDRPTFFIKYTSIEKNELGLIPVEGMGLGFTVLQRDVVEALVARAPRLRDDVTNREVVAVFRLDSQNGSRRGEDMAFFADIRALGYTPMLDPLTDLGHIGTKEYTGSIRDAF